MKATVEGTANYAGLESNVISFTILKTIELVMKELELEEIGDLTGTKAYVRGFTLGSSVESLIGKLKAINGATFVSFRNGVGEEITTGIVSTGMEFTVQIGNVQYDRIIVIMGDANGDGKIQATDYVLIKNQIMDEETYLFDEYALAADIDDDGNIYATDYKATRNHIMEVKEIVQKTTQYN